MAITKELSLSELRKKLATSEIRRLKTTSQKIFELRKDHVITRKVAVDSGTISNGSWYRGIAAEKQKRQAGVNGRPPIITQDLIEKIENQVIVLLSKGETIRVKDVHKMIVEHLEQSLRDEEEIKIPGLTAAYYTIQRSSVLKSALSKPLDSAKISSQSSSAIQKWFEELHQIVNDNDISASGIFNFDETSLHFGDDSCKLVVCLQNQKPPSTPLPKKTSNTTLCLCACADGSCLPSYLLWPAKKTPSEFLTLSSFNINYIFASSGWITTKIFEKIMCENWLIQIEEKMKKGGIKSSLFLMDNHSSHCSEAVEIFAKKRNIIIKKFPPNLTHLLQPCDNSIFARFKKTYNNNFKTSSDRSASAFRSAVFDILPEALSAATTPSNIKHAFRQTGVWPVKAAPVLERISGEPERNQSLCVEKNKEQLYGRFSPKKMKHDEKTLENMKADIEKGKTIKNGKDEERKKTSAISDVSILMKKKKKRTRNEFLKLMRNEEKDEMAMMNISKKENRNKSEKKLWRKCLRIEYNDDESDDENAKTI